MAWVLYAVAFVCFWGGVTLIIDGWHRRPPRKDLAGRLAPYVDRSVGDEAEEWLRGR